jgi:GNAT superfamily N-acetyltransferase
MSKNISYKIIRVKEGNYDKIIDFVMGMRQELFPMLNHDQIPHDLIHFEEYYVQREDAAFYTVVSDDNSVMGSVGICPYDNRFTQLKHLELAKTAEIVKCYGDSKYRRLGIGTVLSNIVTSVSRDVYDTLYLHTHPFLPGAIPFWKSQGYKEVLAEKDPTWQTLHMIKRL